MLFAHALAMPAFHAISTAIARLIAWLSPAPANPKYRWGYFSGPVRLELSDDGRSSVLLEELRYTDPNGRLWVAPKGWRVDGASIPRAAWSLVGGPYEGKYRDASVIHDVACDQKTRPWQDVHECFYWAMLCRGVPELQALAMFAAVWRFGPRWFLPTTAKLLGMGESYEAISEVSGPRQSPSAADIARCLDDAERALAKGHGAYSLDDLKRTGSKR